MRLVCYIWFESNTAICFGGGHASFPTHTHITLVYELCAENICAQFPRQAHEIQAVCSVNSQKGVRTQKKSTMRAWCANVRAEDGEIQPKREKDIRHMYL